MSPQDAAHHRAPAAPPGIGEDSVPFVCPVRAPSLPALLPLPSAAAVPEALLALLYHLLPTALLPPAAPAQLAAGPPGHGLCVAGQVGWAGQGRYRCSVRMMDLLASLIPPRI